jgi:phage-related baseplate assembly protein
MPRFKTVDLASLRPMDVVVRPNAEALLSERMAKVVELWAKYDPPAAAVYDVQGLEFDPIKITEEADTVFHVNVLSRINQTALDVTLAFAAGPNLDAIATRYPGGVPRLPQETYTDDAAPGERRAKDGRYRERIWGAASALSRAGTAEGYEFLVKTLDGDVRDVTATAQRTPQQVVAVLTVMMEGPEPIPTVEALLRIRVALMDEAVVPLTDVVTVQAAAPVDVRFRFKVWLFPFASKDATLAAMRANVDALHASLRWLDTDHTRLDLDTALNVHGVHHVTIEGMTGDLVAAGPTQFVRVLSTEYLYMGTAQ